MNKATVVITTKNRKAELRDALTSVFNQSVSLEVLVMDDGSTDGTAEMVRAEFPDAILHRSDVSRGLIVQRNRAAQLATTPFIFSIDDDAAFSTPLVVEQTLNDFDDPRVGAVAIPYIEPNKNDCVRQRPPSNEGIWLTHTFIGTSHALRRDVFLELCGYREELFHQGEESDFCIRLLEAGYVVRLGNADEIYHYESPRRDFRRMDVYGPRNAVLFAWQNVPMPMLPMHLLATSVKCALWTLKPNRLLTRLGGLLKGYLAIMQSQRVPVSRMTYCLIRDLRRRRPQCLAGVSKRLDVRSGTVGLPESADSW